MVDNRVTATEVLADVNQTCVNKAYNILDKALEKKDQRFIDLLLERGAMTLFDYLGGSASESGR